MISESFKRRIKQTEDIKILQWEIDSMEKNLNSINLHHSDELNAKIRILKERIEEIMTKPIS